MDTYENKYKEALGWMQSLYNGLHGKTKKEAERYFPELKESEDERIKEAIIATIHLYYGEPLEDEAQEMIAWLEKQGEIGEDLIAKKYLINKGYPIDANGTFPTFEEMYNIIREGIEKQGEHKPAWSEEDEAHIHSLLDRLEGMCKNGSTFITTRFAVNQDMDWLKSLKQRIGG